MIPQNESWESPDERKIPYAVVGAGWILQGGFLASSHGLER